MKRQCEECTARPGCNRGSSKRHCDKQNVEKTDAHVSGGEVIGRWSNQVLVALGAGSSTSCHSDRPWNQGTPVLHRNLSFTI